VASSYDRPRCRWSTGDFAAMAEAAGWNIDIVQMPEPFTASHYRFDAVLTPGGT